MDKTTFSLVHTMKISYIFNFNFQNFTSKLHFCWKILRSHDYFGQYGKIAKIVVNRRNSPASSVPGAPPPQPSVGVYITYVRKEDAARAIDAVDGSVSDGKVLR